MSTNRTILNPPIPRFAINEVSYSRISATKGFVEPLKIARIEFSPQSNEYQYQFYRGLPGYRSTEVLDFTLLESEMATLCEALVLQVSVLERELEAMRLQQSSNCSTTEPLVAPDTPQPIRIKTQVIPPKPRFGVNQVVYLKETAEVVGRLEAYRVDGIRWDDINQWLYVFEIRPRPRRNTTVGDRDDLRRGSVIFYPESQLCLLCEAIPLAVAFLERALTRARLRQQAYCSE